MNVFLSLYIIFYYVNSVQLTVHFSAYSLIISVCVVPKKTNEKFCNCGKLSGRVCK